MRRLFRFKEEKDGSWLDGYARTCRIARKICVKMNLPFLTQVIAESTWRAMGWVCDARPNAVITTLVLRWRSTKWWQSTKAVEMTNDPYNHTRWETQVELAQPRVLDKVAAGWSGDEDWTFNRAR